MNSTRGEEFLQTIPEVSLYYAFSCILNSKDFNLLEVDVFSHSHVDRLVGVIAKLLHTEFRKIRNNLLDDRKFVERKIDYYGPRVNIGKTIATASLLEGKVYATVSTFVTDSELHRIIAYVFNELDSQVEPRVKGIIRIKSFFDLMHQTFGYTRQSVKSWKFNKTWVVRRIDHYLSIPYYERYRKVLILSSIFLRSTIQDKGEQPGIDIEKTIEYIYEWYLLSAIRRLLWYKRNKQSKLLGFTSKEFTLKLGMKWKFSYGDDVNSWRPDIFMQKTDGKLVVVVDCKTSRDLKYDTYTEHRHQVQDYLDAASNQKEGEADHSLGIIYYFVFDNKPNYVDMRSDYARYDLKTHAGDSAIYGYTCHIHNGMSKSEIIECMDNSVEQMVRTFLFPKGAYTPRGLYD